MTRFEAVLRSGATIVAKPGLDLARVRFFRIRGEYGSYRVTPAQPLAGRVRIFAARRQKANPRGGPTLGLQMPGLQAWLAARRGEHRPERQRGSRGRPRERPRTGLPLP